MQCGQSYAVFFDAQRLFVLLDGVEQVREQRRVLQLVRDLQRGHVSGHRVREVFTDEIRHLGQTEADDVFHEGQCVTAA